MSPDTDLYKEIYLGAWLSALWRYLCVGLFLATLHSLLTHLEDTMLSKNRVPWNKLMAAKRARQRASRSRALAKVARGVLRQQSRVPLRWGATELKYLDCGFNQVTVSSTSDGSGIEVQPSSGCTGCLSVPAQGDGESNRDGRKYTIKSIWVSGAIDTTALSDQNDAVDIGCYYAALVLDTQANGATIDSEKVFINPSTVSAGFGPQPLRNLKYSKRFRILAQQTLNNTGMYSMTDGASTGSLNAQVQPQVNLSWKGNIICDSLGTTANITSASDNAIHLIIATTSGLGAVFSGKSRMRFVG